jgi:hypothetical protein
VLTSLADIHRNPGGTTVPGSLQVPLDNHLGDKTGRRRNLYCTPGALNLPVMSADISSIVCVI